MMIGLTGGIGSGKSTALQIFRDFQVEVLDADQITRKLVVTEAPAFKKILEHFGKKILHADGSLNRAKLKSLVFESVEERKWLENLLHPLVKAEITQLGASLKPGEYMVVEIPLLIEAEFENAVNRILVIDCEESTQIERVTARDAMPLTTLQALIKSQIDRNTRLQLATDVIPNDGTREDLRVKVQALHNYYSEVAKQELSV